MNRRPSFSMPSIVDSLKSLESDVPEVIMKQAGDDEVKRYLLNQSSFINQQNVFLAGALEKILTQTILTNGRVNNQEAITEAQQITLDEYKRQAKTWRKVLAGFLAFLAAVVAPVITSLLLLYLLKKT